MAVARLLPAVRVFRAHRGRLAQPIGTTSLQWPLVLDVLKAAERAADVGEEVVQTEKLLKDAARDDADLAALCVDELAALQLRRAAAAREVDDSCVQLARVCRGIPADPIDTCALEFLAGSGGAEAKLFAGEMLEMYASYSLGRGLGFDVELAPGAAAADAADGVCARARVTRAPGSEVDAFEAFRYEAGVHRVQRVPPTEKSGRRQTSSVAVRVVPAMQSSQVSLPMRDLRIEFMRGSGPGGQAINTTASQCRVTHIPTGLSFVSQATRSANENKQVAIDLLAARLREGSEAAFLSRLSAVRKTQVTGTDRSDKMRTYCYPQNRVTDHRVGQSFDLANVLEGDGLRAIHAAVAESAREDDVDAACGYVLALVTPEDTAAEEAKAAKARK